MKTTITRLLLSRLFFQKILALLVLVFVIYMFNEFVIVFLITFLFAYLFLDMGSHIHERLQPLVQRVSEPNLKKALSCVTSVNVIVTLLYIGFIAVITLIILAFVPRLIAEGSALVKNLPSIFEQVRTTIYALEEKYNISIGINETINGFLSKDTIKWFLQPILENLKNVGIFVFQFALALILSFVFIIDRNKIAHYLKEIKYSNLSVVYYEYRIIFSKIEKGFGLIFKAQSIIALANCSITTIGLLIIGIVIGKPFPYTLTLASIVFIFGFIPVLGTVLSSVPILIIGYTFGGVPVIIAVLALIAFVHAMEAYVLNPKIVSSYMDFPVFITFLILLVSEHIFGFLGLLIGVPLFYIFIDILRDFNVYLGTLKEAEDEADTVSSDTQKELASGIRLSRSGRRHEDTPVIQ